MHFWPRLRTQLAGIHTALVLLFILADAAPVSGAAPYSE